VEVTRVRGMLAAQASSDARESRMPATRGGVALVGGALQQASVDGLDRRARRDAEILPEKDS
jgi:hypothetical protein